MFFRNRSIGLEISREGVTFASVSRGKDRPSVNGFATAPLPPEVVRFSFRELNILNPGALASLLRGCHLKLLDKSTTVSVALPDSVGRVMLLDVDARFRKKEEGADVIRWKLKRSTSIDIERMHLDYQVVGEGETGELKVLVALVARDVISQYEDVLAEAGLEAKQIDFTSFNLHRLFAQRIENAENVVFTSLYAGAVTIMIFSRGIPDFFRSKEIPSVNDAARVFQEISSSLVVYRERNPAHPLDSFYCLANPDSWREMVPALAEACGTEPKLVSPDAAFYAAGAAKSTAFSLSGAVGAAIRGL